MISCNRIQYPDRQNLTRLHDTAPLSGYFRNVADDSNKISMWRVLSMADRYKKPHKEYDVPNSYVQLVGKDKHLIVAKLFIDTSLIAERHFKGKIKGDYFVTKRKMEMCRAGMFSYPQPQRNPNLRVISFLLRTSVR